MNFELNESVHIDRDEKGNVQHLEHFQQPFVAPAGAEALAEGDGAASAFANTPQGLAEQYIRKVAAPVYGFSESLLPDPLAAEFITDTERANGNGNGGKLELREEKEIMGTTTVAYQQTYKGLPVWEAGVSVTVQPEPLRVTASQSSVHKDISLPAEENLEARGAAFEPENITPEELKKLLGVKKDKPTINGTSKLIYRYESAKRFDPESKNASGQFQEAPPVLPLPQVPASIVENQHYEVTEVLFTLPVNGFGPVNWRAFIEINTGAVLYLRAFIACATAMIFRTDPVTAGAGAGVTPTAADATLNPFRTNVPLAGLTAANPQQLSGQFVRIIDTEAPVALPPNQPNPPASFAYSARSREFAAANAYHHCDGLFRLMQGMGFNIATYFDGTTFPVPVDAVAFNDILNARAPGNVTGTGSGGFLFGLAGTPFPAVSIAADVRVVLHEFGHTLLWDSVHSPNFGFAHSAGDSLAAILMDPESALRTNPVRRFETFPWELPGRNHGRNVAAGWGWGGVNDVGGYSSEQILSTTHFRLYRSLGGDSTDVNRRRLAARQAAYLIFRAIGSLATSPVTPTPRPDVYATALMNADIGTLNFEGHRGGAFHKVIRWSFEKQGLYQPPGAPVPVTTPGAAPPVDVYINDGRNGEYQYQAVHWECTDVWNRLAVSPGGGGAVHQTPVVGRTNYAYVRVRNRGRMHANNVVVRGYSANPGAGLSFPGDWTPMLTPQIAVAGGIAPGGSVIVGPFRWQPRVVGHECMFMEVTADGDFSNIDPRTFFPCAAGPTPEWRLVPFDNNLAQRNVTPVPGAGGIRGILTAFVKRAFTVRNPLDGQARIEIKAELPALLKERGWRIKLDARETQTAFSLASGIQKEVIVSLDPGKDFSRDDILRVKDGVFIRVYAYADGMAIGGMTYQLDPTLKTAPIEREGTRPISIKDPAIDEIIRNARLSREALDGEALAFDEMEAAAAEFEEEYTISLEDGGAAADEGSFAAKLLKQLGIEQSALGKVSGVRVRKVTLEIDVNEGD